MPDCITAKLYWAEQFIDERHWHRYEVGSCFEKIRCSFLWFGLLCHYGPEVLPPRCRIASPPSCIRRSSSLTSGSGTDIRWVSGLEKSFCLISLPSSKAAFAVPSRPSCSGRSSSSPSVTGTNTRCACAKRCGRFVVLYFFGFKVCALRWLMASVQANKAEQSVDERH